MTIAPIQSAATAIPRQSESAASQLSGNFDTFLTLLTTQLKNQDPLSPMDSNQFTQQLVQFSSVEQQINTNHNLESLIALGKNQAGSTAVSYLGKTVTLTDGTAAMNNSDADWTYTVPEGAQDTVVTVTDSGGKPVFVGHGDVSSGDHGFSWDGKDNNGVQLPDGPYRLTVTAVGADGKTAACPVKSQGVVSEVDLTGDEPILMIGSTGVPLSRAALISDQPIESSGVLDTLTAPFDAAGALLSAL